MRKLISIPLAVVLCGFLSALTIFTYIGNMSETQNIAISDIPLSGPGKTLTNQLYTIFFTKKS